MYSLEFFTNERYTMLKLLANNQVELNKEVFIPLSQQEISSIGKISKLKTNKLLNELKNGGFINSYKNKRSKYFITEKGNKVLEIIENNNIGEC